MFECGEGFNGYYYSEEYEETYTDAPRYTKRKTTIPRNTFVTNTRYYHVPLFKDLEDHKIVHKTEKAILFEVPAGRFWVPKALMKGLRVHKSFIRKYI